MATVPLMCAAACGGLSLVLASNMSRLRNKARRVTRAIPGRTTAGDVEAEKRFLAEPEFQKARRDARCLHVCVVCATAEHLDDSTRVVAHRCRPPWRSATRWSTRRCTPPSCCTSTSARSALARRPASPQSATPRFHANSYDSDAVRSASSLLAAASCFLYAGNALAVGQKVNWARFLSAWGRYVAMAGLIAATAMNA
jgi:hypothetical protein